MASPRTRRVLAEIRPKDDNNVSIETIKVTICEKMVETLKVFLFSVLLMFYLEMFRMWHPQPPVGQCYLWDLDLLGMLGQTPWTGSTLVFREVCHHGQVEGHGVEQDEGGGQQERQTVHVQPDRLERLIQHYC